MALIVYVWEDAKERAGILSISSLPCHGRLKLRSLRSANLFAILCESSYADATNVVDSLGSGNSAL